MKKFILFMLTMFAFVGCANHDFGTSYEAYQKNNFDKKFKNEFGKPASNQDWGFDGIAIFNFTQPSGTRGHNVNGNMWYKQWERPVNVSEAEKEKVIAEFSKVRENAVNTVSIPWDNYWVQQVYQGQRPSVDGTGTRVYPSGVMNRLMAWNFNTGEYEHVNNFNSANNTTEYTDDVTHEKFIGTTLMVDMGTGDKVDQFSYHNTSSSDYYTSYIVLEIDGAYYVGFDIVGYHPVGQDNNANMDVERDWIFDDWIVKISPAMFNMDGAVRIIAEDLGASESDFDYNDVVFDAKVANVWDGTQNSNRLVAWITVRAAGGTLPLFVAGKEVHELFGVDTKVMVNTNNGTISKSPVSFKADLGPANWNISGTEAVKSIPINVLVKEGGVITLNSNVGEPSEKLCVSTAYQWCDERVPIQEEYPDFKRYVTDKNIQWYQVQ
jgi:hypothetical protein